MPVYEEKNKNRITKDGRKFYYKCYYTDMYGNRVRKTSEMFKSRPAAKRAEDAFLASVATTDETDLDIMFEDVYKEWFLIKSRTIKETTTHTIKCKITKNILNFFKPFKLHNIKIQTIFNWYDWLENQNHTIEYDNAMVGYLKEILDYATKNYDFDSKVLSRIEKKKDNNIRVVKNDSEWNYFTYNDFSNFIKSVDISLYFYIFNFLYFTGVRKGEMFALNWNDIDFNKKTLSINKQVVTKLGKKTYAITSTKTVNSDRIIDLDDKLIDLLKEHYDQEKKIYGFNNSWFVFGNIKPISETTLRRYLKLYIEKSNVKSITVHGFRHSHASLLIHLGCDAREVANRLGDTLETVESTYYHMFPEKKTATINTLNNFKNNIKSSVNRP